MRHRDFGLLVIRPHRTTPGYTLFSPLNGKATYIIGLHGDVVHNGTTRWSPAPTVISWRAATCSGPGGCRKGRSTWAGAAG